MDDQETLQARDQIIASNRLPDRNEDKNSIDEQEELIARFNKLKLQQEGSKVGPEPELLLSNPQDSTNSKSTFFPDKIEYENVTVSFPVSKESGLKPYMVFKVMYTFKEAELTVNRRFSDFRKLRRSLQRYLPCHYIWPVHRKRTIVG